MLPHVLLEAVVDDVTALEDHYQALRSLVLLNEADFHILDPRKLHQKSGEDREGGYMRLQNVEDQLSDLGFSQTLHYYLRIARAIKWITHI